MGEHGEDGVVASPGNPERGGAGHGQRGIGVDEREDQADQWKRMPQPAPKATSQGEAVPSGGLSLYPAGDSAQARF